MTTQDENPDLATYELNVRKAVETLLASGGEAPLGSGSLDVRDHHGHRTSIGSAALDVVGGIRNERFGRGAGSRPAYDVQERRVAEYLVRDSGLGGGMDPIGFLISSSAYGRHLLSLSEARVATLTAQLRAAGITPELSRVDEDALNDRAAVVYANVIEKVFGTRPQQTDDESAEAPFPVLGVSLTTNDSRTVLALEDQVHDIVRRSDAELVGRVAIVYHDRAQSVPADGT